MSSVTSSPVETHPSASQAAADDTGQPERREQASRGLRLAHLWVIIPLVLAWFAASIDYIEPYDFWWNIKSGQIMTERLAAGEADWFLDDDVLVWTPVREPYRNPQWGSQLLFYWVYNASPYLLLTLRAAIMSATVGILLWLCFWRTRSMKVASLAVLAAYVAGWTNYGIRPQMLAILPFVAFLFLLERKDEHPQWLPMLVPIMLFWVNVHGSFFLGVVLLGIYAFGTILEYRVRRTTLKALGTRYSVLGTFLWQAVWLAAAAIATLANPYGLDIYSYFSAATNDPVARSLNMEWQAPTLYSGTGLLFYCNLLLFIGSLYVSKRRMRPTEILLVLAFGWLAFTSIRNVMWWGWVTAPILAANFSAWEASRQARRGVESARPRRIELPALNWVIALMLVTPALVLTPLWREANPLVPQSARGAVRADTPTALVRFLQSAQVPAPLFNYMEWGGYMGWALYPRYQMFLDGRFEARQIQVWRDYLSVSEGRADWQQTLDKYGVRTLVLSKAFHAPLLPFVEKSSAWEQVYEDELGVVYVRQ